MPNLKEISKSHSKPVRVRVAPNWGLTDAEVAMWKAVITQALMDAGNKSAKMEAKQEKRHAIEWLLSNSDDFIIVCLNANLDPSYVRQKARCAVKRGCIWRKEPSQPAKPAPKAPEKIETKNSVPVRLRHQSFHPAVYMSADSSHVFASAKALSANAPVLLH